jgi:hypothetical protein
MNTLVRGDKRRLSGSSASTVRRCRWKCSALGVVALAIGFLTAPTAADAGITASSARGTVALHGTQVGAPVLLVTYTACEPRFQRPVPVEVTSFTNTPLPNCQAVLINNEGQRFTLCQGRGTIPPAFHQSRQLLIQPGNTPRCLTPQVPAGLA